MKNRKDWIDELKGTAIFLMVVGHVLLWQIGDVHLAENKLISPLFSWIYTFHMPILMFCSGLLFVKSYDYFSVDNLIDIVKKKAKSLLIPFVCAGLLVWFAYGEYYWFLITLFEFFCINLFTSTLFSKLYVRYGCKAELIVNLLVALPLYLGSSFLVKYEHYPLIDLGHLSLYLYFVLGIFFSRSGIINALYKITVSLLISITIFISMSIMSIVHSNTYHLGFLIPLSAIAFLTIVFQSNHDGNSWGYKNLRLIGRYSMEIYILQYFLHIKLPGIRNFFILVSENNSVFGTMFIEFAVCSLISAIIIYICIGVAKIIETNTVLSYLLFGRKV